MMNLRSNHSCAQGFLGTSFAYVKPTLKAEKDLISFRAPSFRSVLEHANFLHFVFRNLSERVLVKLRVDQLFFLFLRFLLNTLLAKPYFAPFAVVVAPFFLSSPGTAPARGKFVVRVKS